MPAYDVPSLNDYSPERMAARAEIQDLEYRWCRSVDRLDFEGMRSVFHLDAMDMHGAYNGPVDGLLAWIRERHKGVLFSQHFIGNMLIEFSSPTVAVVESYLRTTQRYSATGSQSLAQVLGSSFEGDGRQYDLMSHSRYIDTVEKRDDRWKVKLRTVVAEIKHVMPVADGKAARSPGWEFGARDDTDYIFRVRRELHIGNQGA